MSKKSKGGKIKKVDAAISTARGKRKEESSNDRMLRGSGN
jgi:hypothetical protein